MKFDNLNVWLTQKCPSSGRRLSELGYTDVYGHPQAHIYYENGISEFNKIFNSESYIKAGYICTLLASENEMSIFFVKLKGEKISDFGVASINRENILSFDEQESQNLLVVKEEDSKHKTKSRFKTGAKIAFSGAGLLGDAVINTINLTGGTSIDANTELVKGVKFILRYKDVNSLENSIVLYSSERSRHKVQLFLNTYYKSELPLQAKNPTTNSTSNCFIATACYRDLYSPEVIILRKFRDEVLNKNFLGRTFIRFYYFTSPYFYDSLLNNPKISNKIKILINKLVNLIKQR